MFRSVKIINLLQYCCVFGTQICFYIYNVKEFPHIWVEYIEMVDKVLILEGIRPQVDFFGKSALR